MSFKFEDRQLVVRVPVPGVRGTCCLAVGTVSFVTAQMEWDDPRIYDTNLPHTRLTRYGLIRTWAMGNDEDRWCPAFWWEPFYPDSYMVELYMDNMRRLQRNPPTLETNRWYLRYLKETK